MCSIQKNIKQIIYCTFLSVIFITLCSKCSFLYGFNEWVDTNCLFTVGKSMMNGKVLYKDIFDHKGPLIYLLYGIAYLYSKDTFIGIYYLEIISAIIFLYYSIKILCLYSEKIGNKDSYLYCIMAVYAAIIYSSTSFQYGGSAEELTLPLQAFVFYQILLYARTKKISLKTVFVIGTMAGCILWIKFTLLGLFFAGAMIVLFDKIKKEQYLHILKFSIVFLFGVTVVTIPWVVYFIRHHALLDWVNSYFYTNLFLYKQDDKGMMEKILVWIIIFFLNIKRDFIVSGFIITGILYLKRKNIMNFREYRITVICIIMMYLFIFAGERAYPYYFLPLSLFSVFGIIVSGKYFISRQKKIKKIRMELMFVAMIIFAYLRSLNTSMLFSSKDDFVQYKFRKVIMKEEKKPVLLEYGCQDIGIYTVCDTIPICKYFCKYNVLKKETKKEQDFIVEHAIADYVVCMVSYDEKLLEKYHLVSEEEGYADNVKRKYFLLKRNEKT